MPDFGADTFAFPIGQGRWLLVVVVAVLAATAVYAWSVRGEGRRTIVPWVLRLGAIAMLAWALAGPITTRQVYHGTNEQRVIVLGDVSASMNERDVDPLRRQDSAADERQRITRWDAATRYFLNENIASRLSSIADTRFYAFDQELRPLPINEELALRPLGNATALHDSIRRAVEGAGEQFTWRDGRAVRQRGGTLLVISDGHDTTRQADPFLAEELQRRGWRVFAVPVGEAAAQRDVSVNAWLDVDKPIMDGQSTLIHATVDHLGRAGEQATITLREDGRIIEQRSLTLGEGDEPRMEFRVTPRATERGQPTLVEYRIEATTAEPDRFTDNNTRQLFVQVRKMRINVALFEGQPYWDTRYLIRALQRDADIDLTVVQRPSDERTIVTRYEGEVKQSGAPVEPPLSTEALKDYDVVILGRNVEALFPRDAAMDLAKFVEEQGGAVLLARGQPFDLATERGRRAHRRFEHLMPVEWGRATLSDLRLSLTPSGREHPTAQSLASFGAPDTVVTRLPDMLAATRVVGTKAATWVLMDQQAAGPAGPDENRMAAMVYRDVGGGGRVFAVLTDGLWRWGAWPSRLREFDSAYQAFWSSTIRWLAQQGEFLPGLGATLETSKLTYEPGDTAEIEVRRRAADEGERIELRLIEPGGGERALSPEAVDGAGRRMRATLPVERPGIYRVELKVTDSEGKTTTQQRHFAVRDESIERFDPSARPNVLKELAEATGGECLELGDADRFIRQLVDERQSNTVESEQRWAFDRFAVIAAILLLFGVEWLIRRRMGMV